MASRHAVFVFSFALAAATLATGAPPAVLAHDEATTTVQGHIEEDSVPPLSPDAQRQLEQHTKAATASDARAAAAAVTGNEGQVGQWGPVVNWPVVAVNAALLPNGKVLAYDSMGDNATETYPTQDHTRATVWNPANGAQTPVDLNTGYNIFCSGLAHLMDGTMFIAGGNKDHSLTGSSRRTSSTRTPIRGASGRTWRLDAGTRASPPLSTGRC